MGRTSRLWSWRHCEAFLCVFPLKTSFFLLRNIYPLSSLPLSLSADGFRRHKLQTTSFARMRPFPDGILINFARNDYTHAQAAADVTAVAEAAAAEVPAKLGSRKRGRAQGETRAEQSCSSSRYVHPLLHSKWQQIHAVCYHEVCRLTSFMIQSKNSPFTCMYIRICSLVMIFLAAFSLFH